MEMTIELTGPLAYFPCLLCVSPSPKTNGI